MNDTDARTLLLVLAGGACGIAAGVVVTWAMGW